MRCNGAVRAVDEMSEDELLAELVSLLAEIATLGHVTRARVPQIMNLRLLVPSIQEHLLNFSRIGGGRDRLSLRVFQSIALKQNWRKQQERWSSILTFSPRAPLLLL